MITAIIISLVMAWMLDYAQFAITRNNYNTRFNGFGCISDVLNGSALAPMQYRVAIPWFYKVFPHYESIKIILMALGLFSMWLMIETIWGAFSYQGMFLVGIFYVVNFQYDYTEQYLELAMWAQFLTALYVGNAIWITACLVIAMFCRETSVFLLLVYLLADGFTWMAVILVCAVGISLLIPRLFYGIKPSYLDFGVKIGGEIFKGKNHLTKNLREIKKGLKWFLYPTWFSMLMVVLAFAAIIWGAFPTQLQYVSLVSIPFIILLLFRAMFREGVRIMLPLLVFIVPTIGGLINAH